MNSDRNSPLRNVWRALARLFTSWWSIDRVRAAQRDGRILRVRPPATLALDGREIEVLGRNVEQGAGGAFVSYDCRTKDGPGQIRVAIVGSVASPRIWWLENGREQLCAEADFEIWATGAVGQN